jgi:hypothetical protein
MALNEGQIPKFRGVRVHVSTGYTRVEGNRPRDLPPEIPNVTIRNFCVAARTNWKWHHLAASGVV